MRDIADRARGRRLDMNLSQEALAKRSGVSLGSLKRFESTGEISLKSLLKLALTLDSLEAFESLFEPVQTQAKSLDELLSKPKARKKGRRS